MGVREVIAETQAVDSHAHPVGPLENVPAEFPRVFTEGDLSTRDARHTVNYRAALGVLRDYFDRPEADEETLLSLRADVDLTVYTRDLLARTDTETIIVDDGYPEMTPETFGDYTDATVRPLLRLEPVIEDLVPTVDSYSDLETAFVSRVSGALDGDYVGLKSIVAYRRGLAIEDRDPGELARAFEAVVGEWDGRIEDPVLLDGLLHRALEIAGAYDVPVQFHTGFGDPDAHPAQVDPTLLADCIDAHPDTTIVLLHGGYPYVGEAGYVCATYPNVMMDLSLAIPFAQHGAERILATALELVPTTKLCYASDGFLAPELYVMANERFRTALGSCLTTFIDRGMMTENEATTAARQILRENALERYGLSPS